MKRFLFSLFLLFFLPHTVGAVYDDSYLLKSTPGDLDYNVDTIFGYNEDLSLYGVDGNDFLYWYAPDTQSPYPTYMYWKMSSAFEDYFLLPGNTDYRLWTFATEGSFDRLRGHDYGGSSFYYDTPTGINSFLVDGRTVYLKKFDFVIDRSSALEDLYTNVRIYADRRFYGLVWTDEDLSFIDTEEEMYEYLSSFSEQTEPEQTDFLEYVSPTQGETFPTTSAFFETSYQYFPEEGLEFDEVCGQLKNMISGEFLEEECSPIQEGQNTFSFSLEMASSTSWTYRPIMKGEGVLLLGDTTEFAVVEKTQPEIFSDYSTEDDYTAEECSITNLAGCFQNALVWAFKPTRESLEGLTESYDVLKNKAPFGYFHSLEDGLGEINFSEYSSEGEAFDLGDVSSASSVLSPLRTGIGILFSFLTVIAIFKIVSSMNI
jgi:hypothetical protein